MAAVQNGGSSFTGGDRRYIGSIRNGVMASALLSFLQLEIETCGFIFDTNYCALSIISEAIDTTIVVQQSNCR